MFENSFFVEFPGGNDYNNFGKKQLSEKFQNYLLLQKPYYQITKTIRFIRKIITFLLLSDRLRDRYEQYLYRTDNKIKDKKEATYQKKQIKKLCLEKSNNNCCFILSNLCFTTNIVDYLRKRYPKAKLVFFFDNPVAYYKDYYSGFDIETFKSKFDAVFTYNPYDAEKYGLKRRVSLNTDYSQIPADPSIEPFDVFFIGKVKDRLERILKIASKCIAAGLKIRFYITEVPKVQQREMAGVYYCQPMPYAKMLSIEKNAKAIINIYQSGADGITLRDKEAISMNKVLVTDGKAIWDSPFYTPEKVVDLNHFENEVDKIKNSDENVKWNNADSYLNHREFLEWLANEISK